ncbi:SEC-C metal-binding domain-containing protein [Persicimonas caeni]
MSPPKIGMCTCSSLAYPNKILRRRLRQVAAVGGDFAMWKIWVEFPTNCRGRQGNKRRLGRNDPGWCGSGRKYKRCHMSEMQQKTRLR